VPSIIAKKIVSVFLNCANFRYFRFLSYIFLLCLPLQGLVAQESADTITIDGELWAVRQLPRIVEIIPGATDTYQVFTISKDNLGKWTIGGDLKNPNTELMYVDRKLKRIGPFTSSNNTSGSSYQCPAKAESIAAQQKSRSYNACGSEFYYAGDTLEKVFNTVIQTAFSCALTLCLGGTGYDSDWRPSFRPKQWKLLVSSSLMIQIAKSFQANERRSVSEHVANSKTRTDALLAEINSIKPVGLKAPALKASLAKLEKVSEKYNLHADYFQGHLHDQSIPFSLDYREIVSMEKKASAAVKSAIQRIDSVRKLLSSKLYEIQVAERLIVRNIQKILTDQRYYSSSVDGLLGPGTLAAIEALSVDITLSPGREGNAKTLQAVKASFMVPKGSCSKSSSDGAYMVCFSLE